MGQGNGLTRRPPRIAEAIATLVIPPACREEVLGDLQERCTSAWGYCKDAVIAIPCVIASRIRRVVDPPLLLLQAMTAYLSFLCAVWIANGALPIGPWQLWRLAIPSGSVLLGIILADVYAKPGGLSGPIVGAGLAFLSWFGFLQGVPFRILLYGASLSLILASTTNLLFPPVVGRPQGANGPALWLKHRAASFGTLKWIVVPVVWVALMALSGFRLRGVQAAATTAALIVAYHVLKRS